MPRQIVTDKLKGMAPHTGLSFRQSATIPINMRTTGPNTRINRLAKESEKCIDSNHPGKPNGFCLFMEPSKIITAPTQLCAEIAGCEVGEADC